MMNYKKIGKNLRLNLSTRPKSRKKKNQTKNCNFQVIIKQQKNKYMKANQVLQKRSRTTTNKENKNK